MPFNQGDIRSISRQRRSSDVKINNVPYIHQLYDTPDYFNGNGACNASSALMAITYYGKLPYSDITCSWPYSHTSHYGQYVSEIYEYNGHKYNIGYADPAGRTAYGGYGYYWGASIDRKQNLSDYISHHGLTSSVDWDESWSKLKTEINSNHPVVILVTHSLSDGHYVLAIGYNDQGTVIVNDPYGNLNTSPWKDYDGAGVKYDWPGYNNGYADLGSTVHCFIYAKGDSSYQFSIVFLVYCIRNIRKTCERCCRFFRIFL